MRNHRHAGWGRRHTDLPGTIAEPLQSCPGLKLSARPWEDPVKERRDEAMARIGKTVLFLGRYALVGLVAGVILWLALGRGGPEPPPRLASLQGTFASAVERAAPAVVNIYAERIPEGVTLSPFGVPTFGERGRPAFGTPAFQARTELGSGVIVDADGYVLTNHHVIREAGEIFVALWNGEVTRAELVGEDVETDLALLKVPRAGLPTAPAARADELRVGDVVLAIGNPFGLGKTVTMGIVSATGRADLATGPYEDFIQTDAAINQGNSGGALINALGQVVGINTAMLDHEDGAEGIGFAIPMETAMAVMRQIRTHGRVIRGWLGVVLRDPRLLPRRPGSISDEPGMVIAGVYPGGPAEEAGLFFGDYLTHFAGEPVTTRSALEARIAATPPATRVTLRVVRNGTGVLTEAELVQRPPGVFDSS